MEKIYTAANFTEAHIVKGILDSYEIACEVRGEALLGARGELPLVVETSPTVWIFKPLDRHTALEVIAEYEKNLTSENVEGEMWVCGGCSEQLEYQFTACWKCGRSRDQFIQ